LRDKFQGRQKQESAIAEPSTAKVAKDESIALSESNKQQETASTGEVPTVVPKEHVVPSASEDETYAFVDTPQDDEDEEIIEEDIIEDFDKEEMEEIIEGGTKDIVEEEIIKQFDKEEIEEIIWGDTVREEFEEIEEAVEELAADVPVKPVIANYGEEETEKMFDSPQNAHKQQIEELSVAVPTEATAAALSNKEMKQDLNEDQNPTVPESSPDMDDQ
jgi:hypothetical protein